MNGALQSRLSPPSTPPAREFNDLPVKTPPKALDGDGSDAGTSFKDLLLNSNAEIDRQRAAQKNGDIKGARTDEEFFKALNDKANKENQRIPQNNLDKDAFLKLFITQMQNQDPLNPSDSSEMAAQLAQFHGLEQMLNVNKNLEKMQSEQELGRAVSLMGFVGKDIKLNGGKLKFSDGHLTPANFTLDRPTPQATLEVRDAAGVVVDAHDLGGLTAGEHPLTWDGQGKDGKPVGNGVYTFAVVAKDMQGQDVAATISNTVKVTGVDLQDAGGAFYTEIGKVRINEVNSAGDQGFAASEAKPAVAPQKSAPPAASVSADSAAQAKAGASKQDEALTATPSPASAAAARAAASSTPPKTKDREETPARSDDPKAKKPAKDTATNSKPAPQAAGNAGKQPMPIPSFDMNAKAPLPFDFTNRTKG